MPELDAKGTAVEVELSPKVMAYLEQLAQIGIFGTTVEEVARSLISRQLETMVGPSKMLKIIPSSTKRKKP